METKNFMQDILKVQKEINILNEKIRSLQRIQNMMLENRIEKIKEHE
jgi:hypothetical protein